MVELYWQGNTKELGNKKTCFSATSSTINPTRTDQGKNQGLRSDSERTSWT
jgi:hypothetical protein